MLARVHVGDRPAARDCRDAVAEELAPGDEDTGRARSPDELVGRDEDRVLVRQGLTRRVHLDRDVWRRRREVPEREGAVLVEERRDLVCVRDDPGDVARGREAADAQRPVGMPAQPGLQVRQVDVPVGVLSDDDDVRDRLAPRQLIAVVLERTDEHDGPFPLRDRPRQPIAIVELGRHSKAEHAHELVHRSGRAGPAEDHRMLSRAAHRVTDDPAGLLPEAGGLETRAGRFRMRVGIQRQDRVADVVLDEREGAPRGRVVGVRDAPNAERPGHGLVVADDRGADRVDERGWVRAVHAPILVARFRPWPPTTRSSR